MGGKKKKKGEGYGNQRNQYKYIITCYYNWINCGTCRCYRSICRITESTKYYLGSKSQTTQTHFHVTSYTTIFIRVDRIHWFFVTNLTHYHNCSCSFERLGFASLAKYCSHDFLCAQIHYFICSHYVPLCTHV